MIISQVTPQLIPLKGNLSVTSFSSSSSSQRLQTSTLSTILRHFKKHFMNIFRFHKRSFSSSILYTHFLISSLYYLQATFWISSVCVQVLCHFLVLWSYVNCSLQQEDKFRVIVLCFFQEYFLELLLEAYLYLKQD